MEKCRIATTVFYLTIQRGEQLTRSPYHYMGEAAKCLFSAVSHYSLPVLRSFGKVGVPSWAGVSDLAGNPEKACSFSENQKTLT